MRFQVPQFIEVEDKIFGPLTFKQFVYVGGAGGICVILILLLPNVLAFILAAPVAALGLALAFYKVNEKPFINLLEAAFNYMTTNKLYIWRKTDNLQPTTYNERKGGPIEQIYVPKLSESKLRDLTWSLDIKENQNPVTKNTEDEL